MLAFHQFNWQNDWIHHGKSIVNITICLELGCGKEEFLQKVKPS